MQISNFFRTHLIKIIGITALIAVVPVFAESAPVYDADSMPQDQEMASDQSQDYPPPPAPGQEGSTFIPVQPTIASSSAAAAPATSSLSPEQRLQRIEQQVSNMQGSDAATRVDSLQDQVQTLRNQIELLTHQLEQIQNQQKTQYADLDKRLNQSGKDSLNPTPAGNKSLAENKSNDVADDVDNQPIPKPVVIKSNKKYGKKSKPSIVTSDTLAEKTVASQPNVAEEQQIYQTAYNLIKSKKYNEAVNALQGMLKRYPSGQFASNAHYWLGELYGLMGKNDKALTEFTSVVQTYPDSPRVSDAQLKVGLILVSELKWPDAKLALKKVINHYPGSASARLAAEQLKQIKQAGH